jgi:hypothetical protein
MMVQRKEDDDLLSGNFRKGDIILGKTIVHMYKTEYVPPDYPDACTPLPTSKTNPFLNLDSELNYHSSYYAENNGNVIYDIIRSGIRYRLIPKGEDDDFDFESACHVTENGIYRSV